MAKIMEETLAIIMNLGLIFWFKERNRARPSGDYGSEKDSEKVLDSLTERGWMRTGDGVIEVVKMTPEDQATAMKLLTARWEELQKEAEQTNNTLSLKAWEAYHVENGKLKKPTHEGISGNRRGFLVHKANILRMDPKREGGPLPPITEVPVIVKEFANMAERLDAQMKENTLKAEGYLPPSDKDLLMWSRERVQLGGTQNDLRNALTATTGQKMYWIIELDRRFPKAGFIDRLLRPVDDPMHVRLSAVKGAELPKLGMRSDPKALEKENTKLRTAGKDQIKPLDLESFQAYINDVGKKPEGNDPKMMKKDNVESLRDNNKNVAVQRTAKAIIANDTDGLKPLNDNAEAFNALVDLIDDGDGPFAQQLLAKVVSVKGDVRTKLIKKMLEA